MLRTDDMKLMDFHLNCCSYRSFFLLFAHFVYLNLVTKILPQDIFKVYHPRDTADAVVWADFLSSLEGAHSFYPLCIICGIF